MATTEQPVAIVTGASGGIALGVTQALLQRGWRVVATSRTVSNSKNLNLRLISYLWMERSARRKPL